MTPGSPRLTFSTVLTSFMNSGRAQERPVQTCALPIQTWTQLEWRLSLPLSLSLYLMSQRSQSLQILCKLAGLGVASTLSVCGTHTHEGGSYVTTLSQA